MKTYTFSQWISGEDLIPANEIYFVPTEWRKILKKQEELFHKYVQEEYKTIVENFEKTCKKSIDKIALIRSAISDLERILDKNIILSNEETVLEISEGYIKNIPSLRLKNIKDYKEFRRAYNNILEGKFPSHRIIFPKEKMEKVLKTIKIPIQSKYSLYKLDETELLPHIIATALHKFYYEYISNEYINISDPISKTNFERIKWLGSPSQFGYLMLEFVKKGFIEPPKTRGTYSYAKLAEQCFNTFQMETTIATLKKEISNDNSLTPANCEAFNIPNINDLS